VCIITLSLQLYMYMTYLDDALTGNVTDDDVDDFVACGADLVILKPLTIESFNIAIAQQLVKNGIDNVKSGIMEARRKNPFDGLEDELVIITTGGNSSKKHASKKPISPSRLESKSFLTT
jgi:hypothetical protein